MRRVSGAVKHCLLTPSAGERPQRALKRPGLPAPALYESWLNFITWAFCALGHLPTELYFPRSGYGELKTAELETRH